jgi:hypothetical protein
LEVYPPFECSAFHSCASALVVRDDVVILSVEADSLPRSDTEWNRITRIPD